MAIGGDDSKYERFSGKAVVNPIQYPVGYEEVNTLLPLLWFVDNRTIQLSCLPSLTLLTVYLRFPHWNIETNKLIQEQTDLKINEIK